MGGGNAERSTTTMGKHRAYCRDDYFRYFIYCGNISFFLPFNYWRYYRINTFCHCLYSTSTKNNPMEATKEKEITPLRPDH